jgi:simple sugar transport system ATP-binding protein/ribose transport system ATP-binding protein
MVDEPVDAGAIHLAARGIGKSFGSTRALDRVTLEIRAGSVHALVGENGAGKSTLGKILGGTIAPDQGELLLRGDPVAFGSPREALAHGIALVAQELALVPRLTVAQNVFLGVEPRRAGVIDPRALAARFDRLVGSTGFDLPAGALVGGLSLARQQQVEILRALARDAELIVLDEPTASLSGAEADRLHEIVRRLAASGSTVVLVSHYLREVLDLADTVTILRDGRLVRTAPAASETEASVMSGMLGRSVGQVYPARPALPEQPRTILRVDGLDAPGVRGVSFELRAGEIVGLAGLVGAGRTELAHAIFGSTRPIAGRVEVDGVSGWRSPDGALRAGVALIPESRKREGLLLGRPVRENVSLASLRSMSRSGLIARGRERSAVAGAMERSTLVAPLERPAGTLSGGNQQKLLFARAVLAGPRLLIADEPTRGIDIGARHALYVLLTSLASDGMGILLISSEVEEVLGLAHRVLVMRAGRIAAELEGERMTASAILEAAFAAEAYEPIASGAVAAP